MQPWALVTPASRGLGLALARRLLQTTDVPVLATARGDLTRARADILDGLPADVRDDRLHVLRLDVLDEQTMRDAAAEAARLFPPKTAHLRLALCVPGVLFPERAPAQIEHDAALLTLRTNALGPLLLLKHFAAFLPRKATPLDGGDGDGAGQTDADRRETGEGGAAAARGLPSRAVWATMSARVGSISDNALGGWYSYRASKAAVNQAMRTFDTHLRTSAGDKAVAIALHPGTVKTGLSKEFWGNVKEEKLFSPEFAAERLMEVVNSRSVQDRGKCWDWKGEEVPP